MAGSAKQSSDAQADWIASSQELLAMTAFIDYVPVDFQSKAAVRNHDTAKIALSSVIASEARQSSETRADWIASSQELLAMAGLMDHVAVGLQSKAASPEKCH